IGVTETAKKAFREEILIRLSALARRGQRFEYTSHDRLREAIEKKLFADLRDVVKITTSTKTPDGEQLKRINEVVDRLVAEQGDGGSQPGDRVGRGRQAGDGPGVDYLEAEIALDDLAALLFEDLGLPNLERKQAETLEASALTYNEVARRGQMANLDKRRTVRQNIKRNALAGRPRFAGVTDQDLRFRIAVPQPRRETNAVILAMRDVSGSMGEFEKYVSRSFYFWMLKFLRTKYERVQVAFVTHHTEAREVDEETFFKLGESGGTKASSAYELALRIVGERYDPSRWNVYPFHFSDGDNWGDTDNRRCVELVEQLIALSSAVGYGEIRQGGSRSTSTLMSAFQPIADPRFIRV